MRLRIFMFIMVAMLSFVTASAQESKNMEFMGIPISGNLNEFSNKLKSKGFVSVANSDGLIALSGKFTNREVLLVLAPTTGTNNIYRVGVMYEPQKSWDNLESHHNYLVELFTKKYGAPKSSVREINSLYRDRGNHIFMGFYYDMVKYSDTWDLPSGFIQITISPSSYDSASILIIYDDRVSAEALEDQIMNDI